MYVIHVATHLYIHRKKKPLLRLLRFFFLQEQKLLERLKGKHQEEGVNANSQWIYGLSSKHFRYFHCVLISSFDKIFFSHFPFSQVPTNAS